MFRSKSEDTYAGSALTLLRVSINFSPFRPGNRVLYWNFHKIPIPGPVTYSAELLSILKISQLNASQIVSAHLEMLPEQTRKA